MVISTYVFTSLKQVDPLLFGKVRSIFMQLKTSSSINIVAIVCCKVAWINKPNVCAYLLPLEQTVKACRKGLYLLKNVKQARSCAVQRVTLGHTGTTGSSQYVSAEFSIKYCHKLNKNTSASPMHGN